MRNPFLNATAEFDARAAMALMPGYAAIYNAIYGPNPSMQVVDGVIYAAKVVGQVSSFSDLFKADDSIKVGKTSLDRGMLPANQVFLVTGIAVQYAVSSDTTDGNLLAATFGLIPTAIRNGELTIRADGRTLVHKLSGEVFHNYASSVATGDTNVAAGTAVTYTMENTAVGYFQLQNPKWLFPQIPIEAEFKFSASLPSANSCVKIILFGATNVAL